MRGTPLFVLALLTCGMVCAAPRVFAQETAGQPTQQAPQQSSPQAADPNPSNVPEKTAEDAHSKVAARELPAKVTLAGGTRIAVVLETPLSTRIAKKGQEVTFRATQPIALGEGMELSEQAAFIGTVVEAKRPGAFGRQGALKVELKRIDLPSGSSAAIAARLDSPEMRGKGRISSDKSRSADLINLATWTLVGTALGGRAAGGKGAGYGAASGATIWLIMMMSHRGADVYLEPGMPFTVLLDEAAELPGSAASFSADNQNGPPSSSPSSYPGSDTPRLKHRPKP